MTSTLLFGIFLLTLAGIAVSHRHALRTALGGLAAAIVVSCFVPGFDLPHHLEHEGRILANLAGLLLGFAALAAHFERSHAAERLTARLPNGRAGAFGLLLVVFVLSAALDNIAAALIGASAASTLFQRRLHVGYLAAIVAAANAGGAGSVIGDTTTTMLWFAGASPLWIAPAALGAVVAFVFFGWFASGQQHALQPLVRSTAAAKPVDGTRLAIVGAVIAATIATNLVWELPAVGVWGTLLLASLLRPFDVTVVRRALPGTCFLLALVLTASLMPVHELPEASMPTTFALGLVSSIFDNIPLTKLAIDQGGYDWGLLAFAVGYGGSMLWFGSSAGVAVAGVFDQAKSVGAWLRHGWHVAVGFALGFVVMFLVFGWSPRQLREVGPSTTTTAPLHHR
ncbi:MAG: citrate transporter [Planctomycetes bacterium]|nr:citrate transporter [Planctomycetota bacterium]